jgi:hypothetical protein
VTASNLPHVAEAGTRSGQAGNTHLHAASCTKRRVERRADGTEQSGVVKSLIDWKCKGKKNLE